MKNVENKINQLQTKSILKHGIKQKLTSYKQRVF